MESSVQKALHFVQLDIHLPVSQEAWYTTKVTWTSKLSKLASLRWDKSSFVFRRNAIVVFRAPDQICEDSSSIELSIIITMDINNIKSTLDEVILITMLIKFLNYRLYDYILK